MCSVVKLNPYLCLKINESMDENESVRGVILLLYETLKVYVNYMYKDLVSPHLIDSAANILKAFSSICINPPYQQILFNFLN